MVSARKKELLVFDFTIYRNAFVTRMQRKDIPDREIR